MNRKHCMCIAVRSGLEVLFEVRRFPGYSYLGCTDKHIAPFALHFFIAMFGFSSSAQCTIIEIRHPFDHRFPSFSVIQLLQILDVIVSRISMCPG